MFAIMLPLVVGGAGFGVETTYWYLTKLQLQTAADTAAFAGAMEKRSGSTDSVITTTATAAATENGFDPSVGTIAVNTPPLTGSAGNRAVEVILNRTATRFFTQIFTTSAVNMSARAVAKYEDAGEACVLALSYTAPKAALFSGTSNVSLTACSVMSNSMAVDALTVQGSAQLTTECAYATGTVVLNNGVTMSCDEALSGVSPVADPFKNLATPTPSGPCKNTPNGNPASTSLTAGYYCNGMTMKGNVTLGSGVYYVDGDLSINANAIVTGSEVTFYLAGNSKVTINGTAKVTLAAQTSGPYSGILFYGDRNNTANQVFNGTADSSMTGHIYFKSGDVKYAGNFSGLNGCVNVVGSTVEWTGSSNVSSDCSAHGMTPIPATYIVSLVE